eukprot:9707056-Ditylum_brightwellii.AAC.1
MEKELIEEEEKPAISWHAMTMYESLRTLGLTQNLLINGLATLEDTGCLAQYIPNRMIEGKKTTLLEMIWKQVANVLVAIL